MARIGDGFLGRLPPTGLPGGGKHDGHTKHDEHRGGTANGADRGLILGRPRSTEPQWAMKGRKGGSAAHVVAFGGLGFPGADALGHEGFEVVEAVFVDAAGGEVVAGAEGGGQAPPPPRPPPPPTPAPPRPRAKPAKTTVCHSASSPCPFRACPMPDTPAPPRGTLGNASIVARPPHAAKRKRAHKRRRMRHNAHKTKQAPGRLARGFFCPAARLRRHGGEAPTRRAPARATPTPRARARHRAAWRGRR